MVSQSLEHPSDEIMVASVVFLVSFAFLGPSMNCDVIHVYCHTSFVNEVSEYGVHHGLEGGGRVGEPKEHNSGFIEAFVGDECHFPLVFRLDQHLVVSPLYVHPHEEGAIVELVDKLGNEGQRVAILDGPCIYWSIVLDRS